jgi:hypothetical protein
MQHVEDVEQWLGFRARTSQQSEAGAITLEGDDLPVEHDMVDREPGQHGRDKVGLAHRWTEAGRTNITEVYPEGGG